MTVNENTNKMTPVVRREFRTHVSLVNNPLVSLLCAHGSVLHSLTHPLTQGTHLFIHCSRNLMGLDGANMYIYHLYSPRKRKHFKTLLNSLTLPMLHQQNLTLKFHKGATSLLPSLTLKASLPVRATILRMPLEMASSVTRANEPMWPALSKWLDVMIKTGTNKIGWLPNPLQYFPHTPFKIFHI